jgi:signal transduction histidine kinase
LEFVATLVHELRTPLTALRGSLGLLTDAVEGADSDVRNFASIADRNAERLAAQLDEVAVYCRVVDSATRPSLETTDITDAVQRAVDQVQPLVDDRGSIVEVEAVGGSIDAVVDSAMIRLAVARLVSYAVRVSPKKSTIRVRVEAADGGGVDGAGVLGRGGVVISVSDAGQPVAPGDAARIFEPFSALARRGADSAMRTGLSLAIAARIAVLHGGALAFSSSDAAGGGLFTLRL